MMVPYLKPQQWVAEVKKGAGWSYTERVWPEKEREMVWELPLQGQQN